VVVDVCFALMLAFRILVGLVVVLDGRVVVLVVVRRRQVTPVLAVGQVVDHVKVGVSVDDALVAMVGHDASFDRGRDPGSSTRPSGTTDLVQPSVVGEE
jgi:hypothetical protein